MRFCFVSAALLGLAASSVLAAPAVILEEAKGIPPGWRYLGNASATDRITLFVVLKEPGMELLKAKLHQRSPTAGRHLTRDEVLQHRQPAAATARAVSAWLGSGGIRDVNEQGSLLSFEASAGAVRSLFQADLGYYAYGGSDAAPVLRALSYTIPAWLRESVDFVHPLTNFMPPRPRPHPGHGRPPKPSTATTPATTKTGQSSTPTRPPPLPSTSLSHEDPFPNLPCLAATVPDCIKKLYNITAPAAWGDGSGPGPATSPVRLGIAGFLEQWILHSDVAAFLQTFAPQLAGRRPAVNFTVELFNGGTNPQDAARNAGLEASLDVQYALALAHPARVTYYVTGGRGTKLRPATGEAVPAAESDNEPFFEFLDALLRKPDAEIPHVLSISYADDEPSVPRPYARRVCDMFAALAARGVSVLVATGDGGAAGTGQTRCVVAAGGPGKAANAASGGGTQQQQQEQEEEQQREHEEEPEEGQDPERGLRRTYVPTFPASCPYVTAVGATDNVAPPVAGAVFSAGGFSNVFRRPAWQDAAVGAYVGRLVRNGDTARLALFDRTGRATPDISAIGSGFQIIMGGATSQVLGTSASTPVVAAMVALVNDARMRAGKPSLGWLNPLLYSDRVRSVLRDVTFGDSAGCRFPDGSVSPGWSAGVGYDCVTGLGVVDDFADFLAALL